MDIVEKEATAVMTTDPGTEERRQWNTLTIFFCLFSYRVTVGSYITLLIHSCYLNGVVGEGSQSSQ